MLFLAVFSECQIAAPYCFSCAPAVSSYLRRRTKRKSLIRSTYVSGLLSVSKPPSKGAVIRPKQMLFHRQFTERKARVGKSLWFTWIPCNEASACRVFHIKTNKQKTNGVSDIHVRAILLCDSSQWRVTASGFSISSYCNLKCLYFVLSPLPPYASPSPSPVGTLEVDFFMSVEQPTINKCDYYYYYYYYYFLSPNIK